jgi:hypothetical protein
MFPRDSGYEYSSVRMCVIQDRGNAPPKYIKGDVAIKQRDLHLVMENLEAGDYILLTEIDWVEAAVDSTYGVTAYGPK